MTEPDGHQNALGEHFFISRSRNRRHEDRREEAGLRREESLFEERWGVLIHHVTSLTREKRGRKRRKDT